MVDPLRSQCRRLPIDDDHKDAILFAHTSLLDHDLKQHHKNVSDAFRDLELVDLFYFAGASGSGKEPINTYPVIYAGFTEDGDILGVYAIRTDT